MATETRGPKVLQLKENIDPVNGFNYKNDIDRTTLTEFQSYIHNCYTNNTNVNMPEIIRIAFERDIARHHSVFNAAMSKNIKKAIGIPCDGIFTFGSKNLYKNLKSFFKNETTAETNFKKLMEAKDGGPSLFFKKIFGKEATEFAPGKSVRDIIEKPKASEQCNRIYNHLGLSIQPNGPLKNLLWYDNDTGKLLNTVPDAVYDGDDSNVKCYICGIPLKEGAYFGQEDAMECEHLFPFQEAMLFWTMHLNSITHSITSTKKDKFINFCKREYAPVCWRCNGRSCKTNLPIINYNEANQTFILNEKTMDILTKNMNNNGPVFTTVERERKEKIKSIFQPMIDYINDEWGRIKSENGNDEKFKQMCNFVLYKYFITFGDSSLMGLYELLSNGHNLKMVQRIKKYIKKQYGKAKKKFDRTLTIFTRMITQFDKDIQKIRDKVSTDKKELENVKERLAQQSRTSRHDPQGVIQNRIREEERKYEKLTTKKNKIESLLKENYDKMVEFEKKWKGETPGAVNILNGTDTGWTGEKKNEFIDNVKQMEEMLEGLKYSISQEGGSKDDDGEDVDDIIFANSKINKGENSNIHGIPLFKLNEFFKKINEHNIFIIDKLFRNYLNEIKIISVGKAKPSFTLKFQKTLAIQNKMMAEIKTIGESILEELLKIFKNNIYAMLRDDELKEILNARKVLEQCDKSFKNIEGDTTELPRQKEEIVNEFMQAYGIPIFDHGMVDDVKEKVQEMTLDYDLKWYAKQPENIEEELNKMNENKFGNFEMAYMAFISYLKDKNINLKFQDKKTSQDVRNEFTTSLRDLVSYIGDEALQTSIETMLGKKYIKKTFKELYRKLKKNNDIWGEYQPYQNNTFFIDYAGIEKLHDEMWKKALFNEQYIFNKGDPKTTFKRFFDDTRKQTAVLDRKQTRSPSPELSYGETEQQKPFKTPPRRTAPEAPTPGGPKTGGARKRKITKKRRIGRKTKIKRINKNIKKSRKKKRRKTKKIKINL